MPLTAGTRKWLLMATTILLVHSIGYSSFALVNDMLIVVAAGLYAAVEAAKAVTDRPSIIKVHTTIGFGSKKQGTEAVCVHIPLFLYCACLHSCIVLAYAVLRLLPSLTIFVCCVVLCEPACVRVCACASGCCLRPVE